MTETILWRRLDLPGHEIGRLGRSESGWELSGTAVFVHEGRPCELRYAVSCDGGWRTLAARVHGTAGDTPVDLEIGVGEDRRWYVGGTHRPSVAGCDDVDLGFSPSTNLLPIRRLALDVGEEAEVTAAWLSFPALELEPLRQRYRREGDSTYRYESAGGRFVRTLEVRPSGLVTLYPGLWQEETAELVTPNRRGP